MSRRTDILAYGDPHGDWRPLLAECARRRPATVLLVGDCDLFDRPLRAELASLWKAGVPVRYVHGNHDVDVAAAWDNLVGDHPEGSLSGRVETVEGLRIAGLGGTFEAPLWSPRKGVAPAASTREAYFDALADHPHRDSLILKHRASVVPDDLDRLIAAGPADVLLCHEAPTTNPHGEEELDVLAEVLGVRLVVHGHHHESGRAVLPSGIEVRSLGRAEPWWVELP